MSIAFEKVYTRDNTLILQQLFPEMAGIEMKAAGWRNPHGLASIHHVVGGVVQVWENIAYHEWMSEKFLQKNQKNDSFFNLHLRQFEDNKKRLAEIQTNESINTAQQLHDTLALIRKTMFGFAVMYWSGLNEETPAAIRDKSYATRSRDDFWDRSDKLIRTSVVCLYPELGGYESLLLKQELDNPPSLLTLKQRKKGFTVGGTLFAEHGSFEKFRQNHPEYQFLVEDDQTETQAEGGIIRGNIANKGYAKGVVKILLTVEDVRKVEKGDIIVAPMTTPNYILAMKKAAAFVTDEGGVLCHGAIVSREMDKPCVIATGHATKILQDGDLVEVDAEKGIVRKIGLTSR